MISKIIQKEKHRQEEYLKLFNEFEFHYTRWNNKSLDEDIRRTSELRCHAMADAGICSNDTQRRIETHKQSLISLKEYIEEVEKVADDCINSDQLKEDIDELNKMIEKYD